MSKFLLPFFVTIILLGCSANSDNNPSPDNTNYTIPTVNIATISDITETTVNSGGNVTNDGGRSVTAKGICWSITPNPDINDNKTINGNGIGVFNSQLTSLTKDVIYYIKAYATNSEGTAYSNELNFIIPLCNDWVYNGAVTLSSQQDVDEFGVQCYAVIDGPLIIDSSLNTENPITNLSSLSNLETITGDLQIFGNKLLTSLQGLEGVTKVYHLWIRENENLVSISGLSNLAEIIGIGDLFHSTGPPGIIINNNEGLTTLDGLEKLVTLGYLSIGGNSSLTSIQGLQNVVSLNDGLDINGNALLPSLVGLDNLTTIGTYCKIQNNLSLTSLEALSNVTLINTEILIKNNYTLTSLSGLENISSTLQVEINGNSNLISLVGLPSLSTIGNYLIISNNNALRDLQGINGTTLSGFLALDYNSNITTLGHLNNITSLGGFSIIFNDNISSLNGLENLTTITGDIQIAENPLLNDFCSLTNLTNNGTISGVFIVQDNAYNPSLVSIQNGNCSN